MTDLRALPKVELHRHLDGSVRLETIWDIARNKGIDLGVQHFEELPGRCQVLQPLDNLKQVLDVFWVHQQVLCDYESIRRITLENIEDAWLDGVRLLELRFAPAFMSEGKPWLKGDEILQAVLDGAQEGLARYELELGLIAIGVRDLPHAANQEALEAVLRARASAHPCAFRLVGFDLASNEHGIQPEQFSGLVSQAREAGLAITVHTGEETPPPYVWDNLLVLRPQRIGHGIQSWADPELVAHLREQDIHLEICPSSNYLTRAVASMAEHPVRHLYEAGVSMSINTDDPHVMGIDLVHEYELLAREFGFRMAEFQAINRRALEHSFLPEAQKARARTWLDA